MIITWDTNLKEILKYVYFESIVNNRSKNGEKCTKSIQSHLALARPVYVWLIPFISLIQEVQLPNVHKYWLTLRTTPVQEKCGWVK